MAASAGSLGDAPRDQLVGRLRAAGEAHLDTRAGEPLAGRARLRMGVEDETDVGAAQGRETGELVGQPAAPVVELLAAHAGKQRVQDVVAVDDVGVVRAHVVSFPREAAMPAGARAAPRRSAALTTRLEEEQRRGHAHVEAADRTLHGDRGELVAGAAHQRPQAAPLGAEHERHACR